MSEKIHILLLILCGILCQVIIATSSDDDIHEPSDLLAREKRVVDLDQPGQAPITIEQAKYMTIIRENKKATCIGVILSHYTVITAAMCVTENLSRYQVVFGSTYANRATVHRVSSKLVNEGNPPKLQFDGIALITVEPHFVFGLRVGSINLYAGPIRTGILATVNGWGCVYPPLNLKPKTKHVKKREMSRKHYLFRCIPQLLEGLESFFEGISRIEELNLKIQEYDNRQIAPPGIKRRLRQINIPIMDPSQCEQAYRGFFLISHKHICTSHSRKFCARTDIGAPLIINGMLAGIHSLKPGIENQTNPDIFLNLQLPEYSVWLRQNIRFI